MRARSREAAGTTRRLPALTRASGRRGWRPRARPLRLLVARYLDDDGDALATVIAFNALFSLLPFLLTLFAVLSALVQSERIHRRAREWVVAALPADVAEPVLRVVDQGRENLGELGLVAAVSLLLVGSRFFSALDSAFARIYRVEQRPFLVRRAAALVMVPVVSLLLVGGVVASTLATVMLALPERLFAREPGWVTATLTLGASWLAAYAMAWSIYAIVPSYHAGGRRMVAWPGSLVAATGFVLLSQLFPLYLQLTGGFSAFGGAFALALVLLFWLYLLGQIIVIGAEVNALASGRNHAAIVVDSTDAV